MNMTMRKTVSSVFKNHKIFVINMGSYRDVPVQNCPLLADFWPLKSQSRDWAPSNLVGIQPLSAPMLQSNFSIPRPAI